MSRCAVCCVMLMRQGESGISKFKIPETGMNQKREQIESSRTLLTTEISTRSRILIVYDCTLNVRTRSGRSAREYV